jgi:hypothetical protein
VSSGGSSWLELQGSLLPFVLRDRGASGWSSFGLRDRHERPIRWSGMWRLRQDSCGGLGGAVTGTNGGK